MSRTVELRCCLAFVGSMLFASLPTHAGTSIGVTVENIVPGLTTAYGEQGLNEILDKMRYQILEILNKKEDPFFRYWSFTADAGSQVRLAFRLTEPQPNEIQLQMEYIAPGAPPPWHEVWKKPPGLLIDGYPTPEGAAGVFASFFIAKVIKPNSTELRNALQVSAPLAIGGKWDTRLADEPRVVLPLRWDQFKQLRKSEFRLACKWPQRGTYADLKSHAAGTSAPYEDAHGSYPGLVVIPLTRSYLGREQPADRVGKQLLDLVPESVYLLTLITPDLEIYP